jgi:Cft2 family RNA processing exonuclease
MNSEIREADIVFRNILNKDRDKATCNILKVGDITMMFDCGCDEQISKTNLEIVMSYAKDIDFIFLSHASFMHVGALPYLAVNN